ncbi:MAG: guanosine monophosphate reductase [Candidatus Moranbacteria bacterium]|nr:guanosine monophosphate reductase [Candidatus Moranbacteria bacterium]
MKKIIGQALTFDDVIVAPGISQTPSFKIKVETKLTEKIHLKIPIISAAMDTVSESKMAIKMAELGGLSIIHRNLTVQDQVKEIKKVKEKKLKVGAAVGTSGDFLERSEKLIKAGCDILSIDLAHASTKWAKDAIIKIKRNFKDIQLIAGNVATYEGAKYLAQLEIDAIKVGIGGGSICTTRVVTGTGVPNITAIMEVKKALKGKSIPIIIDGGLRFSGDLVKALAAGADCVMAGSLLAGTDEAPGKILDIKGRKYKSYRGMSVLKAMNKKTRDRYYLDKGKTHVSQGVSGLVPYKGKVEEVLEVLIGGVKSGMENAGVKNIKELQKKGRFYQISNSGLNEGHAHDILVTEKEKNY